MWFSSNRANETLKVALAMGADRAVHFVTEDRIDMQIQPLLVSRVIKYLALKEKINMILMGKQSIDDDYNQTGQLAAALLGWPQATFASKIDLGDGFCTVEREIDGGIQTLKLPVPCLVTCDLRLNEPRNASIKAIMAAKKKPIDTIELKSIDVGQTRALDITSVEEPSKRKGGVKVKSVDELIAKLKNEAKII